MALVVKVKYQGILRRLTLQLREEYVPEINMDALKCKIRELFKLNPNADMSIAYTDEDGDVVTMADDVDFLDAVRQGLNPLRLDVSLATEPSNSERSSTPAEQRNEGMEPLLEALRKVSDPTYHLRALSEVPVLNSVFSSPAVAELMRLGTANFGSLFEAQSRSGPNRETPNGSE